MEDNQVGDFGFHRAAYTLEMGRLTEPTRSIQMLYTGPSHDQHLFFIFLSSSSNNCDAQEQDLNNLSRNKVARELAEVIGRESDPYGFRAFTSWMEKERGQIRKKERKVLLAEPRDVINTTTTTTELDDVDLLCDSPSCLLCSSLGLTEEEGARCGAEV